MKKIALSFVLLLTGSVGCRDAGGGEGREPQPGVAQAALNSAPIYADPSQDQVINGPYSLTFDTGVVGVLDNVRMVDGVKFASIADALADLGTQPGWVIVPPGFYEVTDTITISSDRQHILGAGKFATQIDFNPSSDKPLFKFANPGNVLHQNSIGGMGLQGLGSSQKTAILAADTSELYIHDIAIAGPASSGAAWSGGSSPSIGLEMDGTEFTTIARVTVSADRPVHLGLNPDGSNCGTPCVSNDHLHLQDLYLVTLDTAGANVFVESGSVIRNWIFDGTNALVGGRYGVLWDEAVQAGVASQNLSWSNVSWEDQADAAGYAVKLNNTNVVNMTVTNFAAGAFANGFFLRGTQGATFTNCTHERSSGVAIDADATNVNLQVLNPSFRAGAVVSLSAAPSGVSAYLQGSVDVGGESREFVKIDGRGAFSLAAEAACLAMWLEPNPTSNPTAADRPHGDRFVTFSPGTSQTCEQACAATTCIAAATCVAGWTMWSGSTHYQYGNECSVADPSLGQNPSGKYCCCGGTHCAVPMFE